MRQRFVRPPLADQDVTEAPVGFDVAGIDGEPERVAGGQPVEIAMRLLGHAYGAGRRIA